MPVLDLIKTSFAAGELAEGLAGRVDLAKYAVGASTMRNFYVDARGGASTRPGLAHVGRCRIVTDYPAPRLIPFVFSSDQAYVLELNGSKMRVIEEGAYVTTAVTNPITAVTTGATTVITSNAHGLAVGDFVVITGVVGCLRTNGISGLNGRTFYVAAVTTNTFTVEDYGPTGGADYVAVVSTTWTAWTSGGTVRKIYEISTPWAGTDLFTLNYAQQADILTVTSTNYPVYEIRRSSSTSWTIAQVSFGSTVAAPTGLGVIPAFNNPAVQQYQFSYCVTAVDDSGRESTPSEVVSCINSALNQSATPNIYNLLQWPAVSGAFKYRIYKANPLTSDQANSDPKVFGLVGQSYSNQFQDLNYAAEFDQGPPSTRNPFLDGALASATITAGGSGYVSPYGVISGTGSGASISLGSDLSASASPYGEITVANIVAGGTGFTGTPTLAVFDGAPLGSGLTLAFSGSWVANPLGTGFVPAPGSITISSGGFNYHHGTYTNFITATAGNQVGTNVLQIDVTQVVGGVITAISWANTDITPTATTGLSSTGAADTIAFAYGTDTAGAGGATITLAIGGTTNPACVGFLEQRRVFAGSLSNPSSFNMSTVGQLSNFDVHDPIQDDDAISATIYTNEVNLIHSLVSVNNGLMALTSGGAYLIKSSGDGAVTPSTVKATSQAFTGAQVHLPPLRVGDQILYAQSRGSAVRTLEYDVYSNSFTGKDVSVLSSHLLRNRRIVQWAWAEEPYKLVWAVRDDGVLLSCTFMKEQEVYGWARHDTMGLFVSVASVPEGKENSVYFVVQRYREGYPMQYHVERMASRTLGANPALAIKASSEEAYFVDGGAQYPLTYPASALSGGEADGLGEIYDIDIITGGSGYTAPTCYVRDPTGTGAEVTLTLTADVITGFTIVDPGSGYTAPEIVIEDATGAGARLQATYVNRFLLNSEAGSLFSSGDVGKIVRVRGGRGTVLSAPAGDQIEVDFDVLPAGLQNLPGIVLPRVPADEWSMTTPVGIIGGLDHLNGATVQILADGNVLAPQVVSDGCIDLGVDATRITAGQGYTCQLRPMRIETKQPTSQASKRLVPNAYLRVEETRGLWIGPTWDNMREIKMENIVAGGSIEMQAGGQILDPTYDDAPIAVVPLSTPDQYAIMPNDWNDDCAPCIMQSYPLPASVLALIINVVNGDDLR